MCFSVYSFITTRLWPAPRLAWWTTLTQQVKQNGSFYAKSGAKRNSIIACQLKTDHSYTTEFI